MPMYRRAPIVLVRGQGARVWDAEGASISTSLRASASPRSATRTPASRRSSPSRRRSLVHTSNLFFHPFQSELAEKLFRCRA